MIFLVLFLVLMLYVLLMPIIFFIDTATNQFYIQLKGLATASLEKHSEEIVRIKLKVIFFKFYFYPLRKRALMSKQKLEKRNMKKSRKRIGIRKIVGMIRSFKVKRILIDIDTGDCIANAKLYPIFTFLNYHIGKFNINFDGRNRMALHMQNRPIHIIKSFIKS